MKKLFCFALCLCMFLSSCKDSAVPVQILAENCLSAIEGADLLGEASTDYLRYCIGDSLSDFEEYILLYPFAGTVYKEIGIFKRRADVSDSDAKTALNGYLEFRKKNWDTRYKGEEFQKIERARVVSKGRYYLITILDDGERDAVEKIFTKQSKST